MRLGNTLSLGNNKVITSAVSLDTSTQALLDYADGLGYTLPVTSLTKLNTFIVGAKALGAWAKCDAIWALMTDGDANFAKTNIKNPGTHNCTNIGTPLFTTNKGFSSNGGANALNTNFTPSIHGVNYTQNLASYGYWQFEAAQTLGTQQYAFGSSGSGFSSISRAIDSANSNSISNINGGANIQVPPFIGSHHVNRSSSTLQRLFANGVEAGSDIAASTALPSFPFFICARTTNGTSTNNPYQGNISFAWVGGDLSVEAADWHALINTYITS